MRKGSFSVGIIGGGLAGLSAASALAERGIPVELFERRDRLGGRAGAFWEPTAAQWIDFGQHVLLGCCSQMLRFCQQTGLDRFLRRYPSIDFVDPQGRTCRLQGACWLPAPLHLLPAFLRLVFLSWEDRWKTLRGFLRLMRFPGQPEDLCFGDWLQQQGLSASAIQRFWTPVVLSALADLPERTAFSTTRKVFVEGFLSSRDAYHLLRPTMAWGQLLDEYLGRRLAQQSVLIHRRTPIRRLEADGRQVHALLLKDGTRKRFDFYILAVPWRQTASLLPGESIQAIPQLAQAACLEPASITTWHLWLDRPITELPQAAVIGKRIQWLFAGPKEDISPGQAPGEEKPDDAERSETARWGSERLPQQETIPRRTAPAIFHSANSAHLPSIRGDRFCSYQVVISGTHALPKSAIPQSVEEVLGELADIFPAAKEAHLLAFRRVKMAEAVFSPRPGGEGVRPDQKTPLENLALAGDWTATGWPATMESAVRSGYQSAQIALE